MSIKYKEIKFSKLVGAGNDFVLIDNRIYGFVSSTRLKDLAGKICDRKYGVGADGLLVLDNSRIADVKMRIFNADGSEAEMCGNGARCFAFDFSASRKAGNPFVSLETRAGIVRALVKTDNVKINMIVPWNMKLDIPLKVSGRNIKVNFINTGVPHAVIFVEGLKKLDVNGLGREIRNHRRFSPAGTNVNFVEVSGPDSLRVRTFERGVEGETLACGTGSTAAALIYAVKAGTGKGRTKVLTAGGEVLKVHFTRTGDRFQDVWLEGKARLVYRGEYYV